MAFLLTGIPNSTYFSRLNIYLEDPTSIKGIDFVGPMALKAIERLRTETTSKYEIKLDSNFNLDYCMDEIWIESIRKVIEKLPSEVIETFSAILEEFPQLEDEVKNELAQEFIKTAQKNKINLAHLFRSVLGDQKELFEIIEDQAKRGFRSYFKKMLCDELLKWHVENEKERIFKIYKFVQITPFLPIPKGLEKEERNELLKVKMKYFNLLSQVNQKIYINNFLLNVYKEVDEEFWVKEIIKIMRLNKAYFKKKRHLEKNKENELLEVKEKYKRLLKKEKIKIVQEGYVKVQYHFNVKDKTQHNEQETAQHTISDLDLKELVEFSQIMQFLTQNKKEEKWRCTIM